MPETTTTFALSWDNDGERFYETGVSRGVFYPLDSVGTSATTGGVAWNGLTGVTVSPSGAEATPLYADDIKYLNLVSAEEVGATVEAYTYPDAFAKAIGEAELVAGVSIGQQKHETFGLCWRTTYDNDQGLAKGKNYKIHILYGCVATASEKAYTTKNDSPEAVTFSYEITTTPVKVANFEPTAYLCINANTADETQLAALEAVLYGSGSGETATKPRLPLPDQVKTIMTNA